LDVLDRRRLIVASLTPLLALITLYTPLQAVNYYLSMLTEVVYEGFGYKVYYREPLIPVLGSSNKTTLVLDVRLGGKPVDFWFMTSGVTADGAREVAKGVGKGRAAKDISGYVDDAVRVLREAGANPAFNGLGMLTFIVTTVEENGEEYIATDVISIPLIPEKARGKEVRVEVDFKPVHKVKVNKTTSQTQGVQPHQTSPPGTINDYCIVISNPYGPPIPICYYWKLKTVHYKSQYPEPVPTVITYIDSIDGDYVNRVYHSQYIIFTSSTRQFSIDLSLVFQKVIDFVVPGPGFVKEITSGSSDVFNFRCEFINSKLSSDSGYCLYFDRPYEATTTFYDEALIATGFMGYLWLVEYEYILWIGTTIPIEKVLDRSLAVYLVPQQSNNRFVPTVMIDDNPYDDKGMIEELFWNLWLYGNVTWKWLGSVTGKAIGFTSYRLFVESQAAWQFGLAIPVGALIAILLGGSLPGWALAVIASLAVGFSISSQDQTFYANLAFVDIESITKVTFNPSYLELTAYLVKEADSKYYKTPFMVVRPYVTPY